MQTPSAMTKKSTPLKMNQAAFSYHPDQAKTPYFIDIATNLALIKPYQSCSRSKPACIEKWMASRG
jgi:hypothetical protein